MPFDPAYITLAVLVLGMNVVPAFMPPTWVILAFFHIHFHLALIVIVVIGALAATSGRVLLANLARLYLRKLFPKTNLENYDALGKFIENNQRLTIPLVLTYAFLPIPSNQVFVVAGLARLDLKIIAPSFLAGRLISYTFWVSVARIIYDRLEDIFASHISSGIGLVIELLGLAVIIAVGKINWKKVLKMT